ncbi:histidine phosphatase family protein [Acetobacter oeni]|uniref:Putative phosphatase PhoE n=1 Tax=Acetobacter oeni TaxID=304077 RepID=A0A511XMT6_9PROT|nr:histidine phosphatase family protein [Acetobacter oeni]MBB3882878.1 putative phosphoglycerate mutase [Acetobacter oeni]NHO18963.1 histidine phosphatase family protein [Acetobacter oeni]GBR01829.1 phosphoglycerate mutase [Acetobacter oeni LMG 21952]GEN64257.1 putative phosphatase PhoE [Acetobacter oeni]
MLSSTSYWYLRHGETDWNRQGLSQGRTDIPLNANGLAQAEVAGTILAEHAVQDMRIERIVSSPLTRALRTAEIAADALERSGARPSLTVDKGLEEVCFGDQEGRPMGDWYDDWIEGHYTPPGAEPFTLLRDRAVNAVNRALSGSGMVMIVAHGALFRALRSAMCLPVNVRLPNAVPVVAEPPKKNEKPWKLRVCS